MLEEVHQQPLHLQSNFAREYSAHVATAASLGWITNIRPGSGQWLRAWLITPQGTAALFNKHWFIPED